MKQKKIKITSRGRDRDHLSLSLLLCLGLLISVCFCINRSWALPSALIRFISRSNSAARPFAILISFLSLVIVCVLAVLAAFSSVIFCGSLHLRIILTISFRISRKLSICFSSVPIRCMSASIDVMW